MLAVDLFCGAGGATKGLKQAGFGVVGMDINPQPNYCGDIFVQKSVFEDEDIHLLLSSADLVWASPPCQRYSVGTKRWADRSEDHPDYVDKTRKLLDAAGVPYVIENVPGAPLRKDLTLCGFMFPELKVVRHRVFEVSGFEVRQPEHVKHTGKRGEDYFTVAGHPGGYSKRDQVRIGTTEEWKEAMGIDWMTAKELVEAIPPAYSKYIAEEFKRCVGLY